MYLKDARDWIVNILITKKKGELCDGMELVNALVGIVLPYITVSNQRAAHPKLTVLYVNYNSINLEKKFIKKRKKPISCIFGTHQKPRETHSSAASSSATQLGKKKACLLTGHIAKDVCFGSSC